MTAAEIAEVREILTLWGARFAEVPPPDFVDWLTRHGCPQKDAAMLGAVIPEESFTLKTQSFSLSNFFGVPDVIRESLGQTACNLKLIEDGLLAVADQYAPHYYLIDINHPFAGPTYTVDYPYYQTFYDLTKKIDRTEFGLYKDSWFNSIRNLRHAPGQAIEFFWPRISPEDKEELILEVQEITTYLP
jgi:hypothetical protein